MARNTVGFGLLGLTIVFLTILFVTPYLFPYRHVSGFENGGSGGSGGLLMQCQEGRTPCPEGFFCEQNTCVPVMPKYNYDSVVGTGS